MRMSEQDTLWKRVPHISAYMREHLAYLHPTGQTEYIKHMNAFISFCCERWGCNPDDVDVLQCTVLQIGERRIMRPIRREVILEFLNTIEAPTSRNYANTVLYMIFQYFVDASLMDGNPVEQPKGRKRGKKEGLPLREIETLARKLTKMEQPFRTACIIALSAGLRISELCCLRVGDIQQMGDQWIIAIRREALKGKRAVVLPLPEVSTVIDQYTEWRENKKVNTDHLLINRQGKPLSVEAIRKELKTITIDGFSRTLTPHDLRRAYATLMDAYVSNPDVLVQAMRHKPDESHKVTRAYVASPNSNQLTAWTSQLPVVVLSESLARLWLERD